MIIFLYLCTDRPGFPRPSLPPPSSSSSLVASCARISPHPPSSSSFLFFHGGCSLKGRENVLAVRFYLCYYYYCCCYCLLFLKKFRGTLKVEAGVMTFKWPLCHSNRWCNTTGSCSPASPLHHQQSQHIQQEQLHRSSLLPSGETLPPDATSRPLWPSQRWVPFCSNFSLCVAYLPSRTRCVCGWDTLGGVWAAAGVGAVPCGSTACSQVGFQRTTLRQPRGLFARISSPPYPTPPHYPTPPTSCLVFDNVTQKWAAVSVTADRVSPPHPGTHSIARLHSSLLFLCLHGWKQKNLHCQLHHI